MGSTDAAANATARTELPRALQMIYQMLQMCRVQFTGLATDGPRHTLLWVSLFFNTTVFFLTPVPKLDVSDADHHECVKT